MRSIRHSRYREVLTPLVEFEGTMKQASSATSYACCNAGRTSSNGTNGTLGVTIKAKACVIYFILQLQRTVTIGASGSHTSLRCSKTGSFHCNRRSNTCSMVEPLAELARFGVDTEGVFI